MIQKTFVFLMREFACLSKHKVISFDNTSDLIVENLIVVDEIDGGYQDFISPAESTFLKFQCIFAQVATNNE